MAAEDGEVDVAGLLNKTDKIKALMRRDPRFIGRLINVSNFGQREPPETAAHTGMESEVNPAAAALRCRSMMPVTHGYGAWCQVHACKWPLSLAYCRTVKAAARQWMGCNPHLPHCFANTPNNVNSN